MLKVETSGKRITDKTELLNREVWVLFKYSDNSEFCFLTTLNNDILRERGILLEEGKLPRLDKKYYIHGQFVYRQFSTQNVKLSLWEGLTYTHPRSRELHEFL